jgi:hypothetical protein
MKDENKLGKQENFGHKGVAKDRKHGTVIHSPGTISQEGFASLKKIENLPPRKRA